MKILSTALLLLAFVASARADDWNKTYTVSGKPSVHVDVNDARIRVNVGQSNQVSVRVTSHQYKIPDQVRVSEQQSGDSIDIRVNVPAVHVAIFSVRRYSVEVEVNVPSASDLDMHTGDGSIEVQGVKGNLRLASGDGHIQAQNVDGVLHASSGDGHISVDGRFDGIEVRTKDGHIEATVRNGSRILNEWSFHSGDGSIELRVPGDLKADLDAHTGDGHITANLPVEVQGSVSHSALRGHMNGGGPLIRVRTGDGSIRIDRL